MTVNRSYLIVAFTCLLCGKAFAFPQYRLDLQSSLIPGSAPVNGINRQGAMAKTFGNRVLSLRSADGNVFNSQPTPDLYHLGYTSKAISAENRVFSAFTYDSSYGKSKPVTWTPSGGFELLPDLITSPPWPNYSYNMNACTDDGTVAGGSFWFYAGNTYNHTPTRFRKVGAVWTAQFFPGEGEVFAFDPDGTAYGRFNGKAGIWRNDGSLYTLPAPIQGDPNLGPWTMAVGKDDSGRLYGTGQNEIWIWDSILTQPRRFVAPEGPLVRDFYLRVNRHGQCVFTGVSGGLNSINGYYWSEAEGFVQLNSLLQPEFQAEYNMRYPNGIDDQGHIIGSALAASVNEYKGVYLTPVPEPSPLLLTAAGIAAIALKRRKGRGQRP